MRGQGGKCLKPQQSQLVFLSCIDTRWKDWRLLTRSCCCCLVAKLCLTFCNLMDFSPLSSSVHGISQARILEWVTISSSKASSQPTNWTCISCNGKWVLWTILPGKPPNEPLVAIYESEKPSSVRLGSLHWAPITCVGRATPVDWQVETYLLESQHFKEVGRLRQSSPVMWSPWPGG